MWKNIVKPVNGLIKKFPSVYQFCNGDLNKFVLLLRKGVYPYEHMDSWETFNEKSLQDEEAFYSKLKLNDISDKNYAHGQKAWRSIWNKKHWWVSWLVCSKRYFIACCVFENFRDKCIEIYELDPAHFVSAPGLAWQACLNKTGVKLELLTDPDMLLMAEKEIKGGKCDVIHKYDKVNN